MTLITLAAVITPLTIMFGVFAYIYNKDFFGVYGGLITLILAFVWQFQVFDLTPVASTALIILLMYWTYNFIQFFENSIAKAQGEIDWTEFAKEHGLYNRPKQFQIEVFSIATALTRLIIEKSGRKDAIVEFSTNKSTLQVELKKGR